MSAAPAGDLRPCARCGVVRPVGPDGCCRYCTSAAPSGLVTPETAALRGGQLQQQVADSFARLRPKLLLHGAISAVLLVAAVALVLAEHSATSRAFAIGIVIVGVSNVLRAARLYRRLSQPPDRRGGPA